MLGYDPQFRAYKSGRPLYKGQLATKIKNGATGILGAHGFGDRNLADRIWLRGNFVSMGANFRDARDYLPLGLRFTNLGQAPDASVLLYELVKCHQLGLKKLVGFGHSRGGAAFITLLHMLTFPERYKKYFRAMGLENTDGSLNSKKITQLKQMIDQIILAHPLVSVPSTLRHQLGKLGSGAKLLLTLFGDYNLFEKTQLAMLEELYTSKNQSALTPLAISLSPHDEVIGTVHNRDLQMIADKSQGSITIFGEVDSFRHDDLGPALQLLTALTTKS